MWEVEAGTGMSDYNKQTEVEKDFFLLESLEGVLVGHCVLRSLEE